MTLDQNKASVVTHLFNTCAMWGEGKGSASLWTPHWPVTRKVRKVIDLTPEKSEWLFQPWKYGSQMLFLRDISEMAHSLTQLESIFKSQSYTYLRKINDLGGEKEIIYLFSLQYL